MSTEVTAPNPTLVAPHPNLSDEVNRNIIQSEIEGGVYLDNQAEGATLEVETQHHLYTVLICGRGHAFISGHPKFCPTPTLVRIEGSTWSGSMLKSRFIGREMHLEFRHPVYRTDYDLSYSGHSQH